MTAEPQAKDRAFGRLPSTGDLTEVKWAQRDTCVGATPAHSQQLVSDGAGCAHPQGERRWSVGGHSALETDLGREVPWGSQGWSWSPMAIGGKNTENKGVRGKGEDGGAQS